MTDVLASVARLCAVARVGSVTIRASALESERDDSVGIACRLLRDTMQGHGIEALDIATTITDTEFLKLAGILSGAPSIVAGSIVETAEALSIWNVRLRAYGAKLRPTPLGMKAVEPPPAPAASRVVPADDAPAAAEDSDAPETSAPMLEEELALALHRGDGRTVCRLLQGMTAAAFARCATPDVLHVVVEQLLEAGVSYDEGHALLDRAGAAGARAVFSQLVGATDTSERRFLYDLAAGLKGIGQVAREHAHDQRWYVVRNAAGLMGESRDPDMIPDLGKVLRHDDQRVRIAAVVALGQIGGPLALARLESVLFDASIEVRNRALAIVFASPDSDPLPSRVLMALEEENALEYRLEMVAALAHVHTPRARARLEAFARKTNGTIDDHQVRLAALAALSSGHRKHAEPLLKELLEDKNPYVREKAAALLAA
jgi:HEAT repeat protein